MVLCAYRQPVKLSDKSGLTILRIALGADMVIDALTTGMPFSVPEKLFK